MTNGSAEVRTATSHTDGQRSVRRACQGERCRSGNRPALILIAFALAGCAPYVRYVSTYCLTHDQALPAEPPKIHDQLTGQADRDLELVAGSAIRLRAYGEGLRTILEGCREPAAK